MSMIVIYYRSVSDTQGYSSVGRTLVSKTKCRGFESFCPCCGFGKYFPEPFLLYRKRQERKYDR